MPLLDNIFGNSKSLSISIDQNHIDSEQKYSPLRLNDDYFQIVLCQLFIKNMSWFLKEYSSLVYATVGFQYGSKEENISHVIDPRNDTTIRHANAAILNQHIMKPVPFISPKVDVSLGLFRIKVKDNTSNIINLLSSISSDVMPNIIFAARVAQTITKGLNDIIDDKESFVLGISTSFDSENQLKSGYRLLVNNRNIDKSKLWIKDGCVYYGDEIDLSIPFEENDFLLYRIDQIPARTDFRSADSIKQYYERALSCIRTGNADALNKIYKALLQAVASSVEFTLPDIKRISVSLNKELQERWTITKSSGSFFKKGADYKYDNIFSVSEEEYNAALSWEAESF